MDKQIVEQLNSLFKAASAVEGFEAPHREVLPAEIAAQLEAKDKSIADLTAEIEKTKGEKAELQKQLDAIAAERADEKRLADVLTKASELLKDNAFADALIEDVKDAAADKSFDVAKVEGLIKTRTARYEKAAGPRLSLPTGTQGRHLTDEDIPDLTEEEAAEAAAEESVSSVKPAEELSFAKK